MYQCPETTTRASVDELSGHVWIQELPTGGTFRFRMTNSGLVTFRVGDRTFEEVASVPLQYRRAAQLIVDRLDREALRAATDEPSEVTFRGIATWNDGIEYDWRAMPAFVGADVWVDSKGKFLSPDAATGVFDRLDLPTLPAIEKEVRAAHTEFTRFEDDTEFPESAWRSGPAAGLLLRDKSGGCVTVWQAVQSDGATDTKRESAPELAAEYATDERIDRTIAALREDETPLTVASIRDRLVADVAREAYAELFPDGEFVTSISGFQSAVAERVQRYQSTSE